MVSPVLNAFKSTVLKPSKDISKGKSGLMWKPLSLKTPKHAVLSKYTNGATALADRSN